MKSVFADTFYFLALLNERDAAHERAVAASRGKSGTQARPFITSHAGIQMFDAAGRLGGVIAKPNGIPSYRSRHGRMRRFQCRFSLRTPHSAFRTWPLKVRRNALAWRNFVLTASTMPPVSRP